MPSFLTPVHHMYLSYSNRRGWDAPGWWLNIVGTPRPILLPITVSSPYRNQLCEEYESVFFWRVVF